MFEKEAEEYAEGTKTEKELEVLNTVHDWGQESLTPEERILLEGIQDRERAREQGFKDGAEFGYNKAFVEADKNLKAVVADFNKANEWHYPSKGEYPKVEGEYLVIFESDRTKYKGLESYYPDTKEWSTICKIIAWKEIVLPKEGEAE